MSIGAKSNMSYGRGGAGNIRSPKTQANPTQADLITPAVTAPKYTTGRGGSGNIVTGNAAASRQAQDVGGALRSQPKTGTKVLTGRGGGGNTVVIDEGYEGVNEWEWEESRRNTMDESKRSSNVFGRVKGRMSSLSLKGTGSKGSRITV